MKKKKFLFVAFTIGGVDPFYFIGPKDLKVEGWEMHRIKEITDQELNCKALAVIDFAEEPTEYRFVNKMSKLQEVMEQGYKIEIVPMEQISKVGIK